ncbi:MAG TPA: cytochrome c oxidase subunit I [Acidimicrobiales bacterium]|nr:cytochrome c oxidase subunit I [Acidimicrobiales bacterium]
MTLLEERPAPPPPKPARRGHATGLVGWLTTTDHKKIGILYMVTAFVFFLFGGILALLMRYELAEPGRQLVGESAYNQLFTMHGSVMMFLFAVPMAFGFANFLVPLQLGAPDMAFPRLNAVSYWLFLGGGLTMVSGFLTARGAAQFGWTAYTPLSDAIHSPGAGADLWIMGVLVTGVATVLGAVNIIATVLCLRAPGMIMFRMPIFTWNMFIVSAMVILAFPVLTAGLSMLYADRHLGAHFFEPTDGGEPILWQHIFWFFGHPEVYIVALPFFGVVTEVIPVFARKPLFGYKGFVFATLAIASLSTAVWAHHMFSTGAINLPFFSAMTFLIAVPTGVKMFNWIGTMWRGHLTFQSPMLFCVGFLLVFLVGGLTGPMLAAPPVDFHVTDTYFVVAHMHYVLFGTAAFGFFAGLYFWYPKITGRLLSEPLAKLHFWTMLVGFNLTFWPHHVLGLRGMPRRVPDYAEEAGWSFLNLLSSAGSAILGVGTLFLLWNLWSTARGPVKPGREAGDDPWGGNSLEWATSSPPPEHNFHSLPLIRSERPVFDARRRPTAAGTGRP